MSNNINIRIPNSIKNQIELANKYEEKAQKLRDNIEEWYMNRMNKFPDEVLDQITDEEMNEIIDDNFVSLKNIEDNFKILSNIC